MHAVVLLTRQQRAPTASVCQVRRRSFGSRRGAWGLAVAMGTGRRMVALPQRNETGHSLQDILSCDLSSAGICSFTFLEFNEP